MRTWHCVNCDTLLVEAPTDKGHMDCGPHGKICFDCIDRMVVSMKAVRAAEKQGAPAEQTGNSDYATARYDIILKWSADHGFPVHYSDVRDLITRLNSAVRNCA